MKKYVIIVFFTLVHSVLCYAQSGRSDELFAQGVDLYQAGKYKEALRFFEQVLQLDTLELPPTSNRRLYGADWQGACWHKLGNDERASKLNPFYLQEPIDRRLTVISDSLGMRADEAWNPDNPNEAKRLLLETLAEEERVTGKGSYWTFGTLLFLADALAIGGESDKALDYLARAQQIATNALPPSAAQSLWPQRSRIYVLHRMGKTKEAFQEEKKFIEHAQGHGLTDESDYLNILDIHTNSAYALGDKDEFLKCYKPLLKLSKKAYKAPSDQYIGLVEDLSLKLAKMGSEECIFISEEYAELVKNRFGEKSEQYVAACSKVASNCFNHKKLNKAKAYDTKTLEILQTAFPDSVGLIGMTQLHYHSCDYLLGNEQAAKRGIAKSVKMMEETIGRDNAWYKMGKSYMASLGMTDDDAFEAYHDAMKAAGNLFNQGNSIDMLRNKVKLSLMACLDGKYKEAKQIGDSVISSVRQMTDPAQSGGDVLALMPTVGYVAKQYGLLSLRLWQENDSVKYTTAYLEREFLHLRLDMLVKVDSVATLKFVDALQDYAGTSKPTADYLHTQEVASHFANVFNNTNLDGIPESLRAYYKYKLDMALSDCYEDHDPRRIQLLEELVKYSKERYGEDDNLTTSALYNLYSAQNNLVGLASLGNFKSGKRQQQGRTALLSNLEEDWPAAIESNELVLDHELKNLKVKKEDKSIFDSAWKLVEPMGNVVNAMLKLDQGELVPTKILDMMQRVRKEQPRIWKDVLACLFGYKMLSVKDSVWDASVEQVIAGIDDVSRDPSLRACLMTARHNVVYVSDESGKVLETYNRAMQLVSGVDQRLYDELLLQRNSIILNRLHLYSTDLSTAGGAVDDYAREMEEVLLKYEDGKATSTYVFSVTMQLLAEVANWNNGKKNEVELNRLCKALYTSYDKDFPSFFKGGALESFYHSLPHIYGLTAQEEADILYDASHLLGDTEMMAMAGAFWINDRLAELKQNVTAPYYSFILENLDQLVSRAVYYASTSPSAKLSGLAYDAAIFAKGAMMRSEKLMQQHILSSGNKSVIQKYSEMYRTKLLLDDAANNHLPSDSLVKQIDKLKNELYKDSKLFGDYSNSLLASWEDVQRKLTDDDMAIEFASYKKQDDVFYAAVVLKKGMAAPEVVTLCTESELNAVTDFYHSGETYNLVWKPLEGLLEGTKRIYFSPSGRLHQLAIEYVAVGSKRMNQLYDVYRLSNTRVLVEAARKAGKEEVVLFGGIEYDLDADSWSRQKTHSQPLEDFLAMHDTPDIANAGLRGSVNFLEGTEEEVLSIKGSCEKSGVLATCFTGADATEDALKLLSGTDVSILHIATHGFYHDDSNEGQMDLSSKEDTNEDRSMSRSGLLMAGAMSRLKGMAVPDGMNDGVLTARELSRMDLTKTRLVCLSACETGLGKITGDGVFGLQRGFKKAGVKAIMMSLWEVDDEATKSLMSSFYNHLFSQHVSVRQAFVAAQDDLTKMDGGMYDDPEYWAAFILLDALE